MRPVLIGAALVAAGSFAALKAAAADIARDVAAADRGGHVQLVPDERPYEGDG